mmetsp:Transcript_25224/g.54508  ORF Transcript_25224/g.54508 Transcript_25224/m.54508 type:complete len:250 (+) Transcript_25224:1000-1749(+)
MASPTDRPMPTERTALEHAVAIEMHTPDHKPITTSRSTMCSRKTIATRTGPGLRLVGSPSSCARTSRMHFSASPSSAFARASVRAASPKAVARSLRSHSSSRSLASVRACAAVLTPGINLARVYASEARDRLSRTRGHPVTLKAEAKSTENAKLPPWVRPISPISVVASCVLVLYMARRRRSSPRTRLPKRENDASTSSSETSPSPSASRESIRLSLARSPVRATSLRERTLKEATGLVAQSRWTEHAL